MRRAFIALGSLAALAVAGVLGFVVWSALTLPRIDHSGSTATISNCEEPKDKNAQGVCPRLYCEKALRDGGFAAKETTVESTGRIGYEHERKAVIGGVIRVGEDPQPVKYFQCWMSGTVVEKVEAVSPTEWAQKRRSGEWQI